MIKIDGTWLLESQKTAQKLWVLLLFFLLEGVLNPQVQKEYMWLSHLVFSFRQSSKDCFIGTLPSCAIITEHLFSVLAEASAI